MRTARNDGFALVELVVVVAIIGILAALAVPAFLSWAQNQRVKQAARSVADAFQLARSEAIRSGNNHVVFLGTLAATDPAGNPLVDPSGRVVPVLVLNDGPAAGVNCVIDVGEPSRPVQAVTGVNWGVSAATVPLPLDAAAAPFASGSTFNDPGGNPVNWVLFRPDGIPVAFDAACSTGATGSGTGAVYVTNGNRDYAVMLTALGGTRVHAWDAAAAAWSN